MTNQEAISYLCNIRVDIGRAEHRALWHYEQSLAEIIDMLSEEPKSAKPTEQVRTQMSLADCISRQAAIDAITRRIDGLKPRGTLGTSSFYDGVLDGYARVGSDLINLPSAEPEEVIPHRNYKYLSDYWCTCGWHLGKKGEVKYCADCGRKVNWDG